jgi:hypothetical protein
MIVGRYGSRSGKRGAGRENPAPEANRKRRLHLRAATRAQHSRGEGARKRADHLRSDHCRQIKQILSK